jgi:carbon monoxide dehydrogenase subunit G
VLARAGGHNRREAALDRGILCKKGEILLSPPKLSLTLPEGERGNRTMKLSDSREIRAEPGVVWQAILDPEVLKACIPGCESMVGSVADGYEAVVKQKVGPVSATFTGLVQLSDIVEGKSIRISGEGKGGVAGFAKGGANVSFEPIPEGTRLTYEVEASVGGKIAQLGSRIIDGFAKKMADEFFTRFQDAVETPEEEPEQTTAEAEAEAPKKGWFKRLIS